MNVDPSAYLYRRYAQRLRRQLANKRLPHHLGVIMDGNRRWARKAGFADASIGHRYGAEHLNGLLSWCEATGIAHVTAFVCSTENLTQRDTAEIAFLMDVITDLAEDITKQTDPRWSLHTAGLLDVLPDSTANALKRAIEGTARCRTGAHLTLAIGYGGRQELLDAVRSMLADHAERGTNLTDLAAELTAEDITQHLYNAGQPDPDLIIRTSGEQRLSNFLLWQTAYAELYFCEANWPAFREIDFLRALRDYAARGRRYGA